MVIGGSNGAGRVDDIEMLSPDPTTVPVPSCLRDLNPFTSDKTPSGAAGGTTEPGESVNS